MTALSGAGAGRTSGSGLYDVPLPCPLPQAGARVTFARGGFRSSDLAPTPDRFQGEQVLRVDVDLGVDR